MFPFWALRGLTRSSLDVSFLSLAGLDSFKSYPFWALRGLSAVKARRFDSFVKKRTSLFDLRSMTMVVIWARWNKRVSFDEALCLRLGCFWAIPEQAMTVRRICARRRRQSENRVTIEHDYNSAIRILKSDTEDDRLFLLTKIFEMCSVFI